MNLHEVESECNELKITIKQQIYTSIHFSQHIFLFLMLYCLDLNVTYSTVSVEGWFERLPEGVFYAKREIKLQFISYPTYFLRMCLSDLSGQNDI